MKRNWANALRGALLLFFMFQMGVLIYTWIQVGTTTLAGALRVSLVLASFLALSAWLVIGINYSGNQDHNG